MKKASEKPIDVGVVVGRFQVPYLHEGQREVISYVYENHPRTIIVLGLSPCLGTRNNALDFEARKAMIQAAYPKATILYIKDCRDDSKWSSRLDELISDLTPTSSVALYGGRDSFIEHYTGCYPTVCLEASRFISGTEIRDAISKSAKSTREFREGVIWCAYNQYPKCFPTVDVLVFNEDYSKVLLARKPHEKDYRAIGGFASPSSPSYEADARREVHEEAKIEISDPMYIGSCLVDDWRYRGEIDKIKTMLFIAKHIYGRPEGSDDVAEVAWFDWSQVVRGKVEIVPEHKCLIEMAEDRFISKISSER